MKNLGIIKWHTAEYAWVVSKKAGKHKKIYQVGKTSLFYMKDVVRTTYKEKENFWKHNNWSLGNSRFATSLKNEKMGVFLS